jgi:hypothetical protein
LVLKNNPVNRLIKGSKLLSPHKTMRTETQRFTDMVMNDKDTTGMNSNYSESKYTYFLPYHNHYFP